MSKIRLRFNTGVFYNNKLILSSIGINGLWVYDIELGKFIAYRRFDKEDNNYIIHRKAFLYKDEAWFIPQNGKYIAIVDLNSYEISYLGIPYKHINLKGMNVTDSITYDGGIFKEHYLYLVPTGIDALNIVDLRDRSIRTFYNINTDDNFLSHGFYYKDKIYMYPGEQLVIKSLNIETGKMNIDYFTKDFGTYCAEAIVDFREDIVYFAPYGNAIRYIKLDDMKKYEIMLDEDVQTEHALDCGNKIIFWGIVCKKIVILDKQKKSVCIRSLSDDDKGVVIYVSIGSKDNNIALSRDKQCWYRYLPDKDEFEKGFIHECSDSIISLIEKETSVPFLENFKSDSSTVLLEDAILLEGFMDKIVINSRENGVISNIQKTIGEKIYSLL